MLVQEIKPEYLKSLAGSVELNPKTFCKLVTGEEGLWFEMIVGCVIHD